MTTYAVDKKTGEKAELRSVEFKLGHYFNTEKGLELLKELKEEYFFISSPTEIDCFKQEGVRAFISFIGESVHIINNFDIERED